MGTFELLLAARVARALRPLAFAMQSEDGIRHFVGQIGWTLPTVPPSLSALGEGLVQLHASLAELTVALGSVELGDADSAKVDAALGSLALDLALVVEQFHELPSRFTSELPAEYVAATHIAEEFEGRIFDRLLSMELAQNSALLSSLLRVTGVLEVRAEPADTGRFQPAFERHRIRWDRLFRLTDPASIAREVYGWGTPTINSARLFAELVPLSFVLGMPAEFRYATEGFTQKAAPGDNPDSEPASQLWIPVFRSTDITFFIVVTALPKASPNELQGLALTLVPSAGGDLSIPFGDELELTVKATTRVGTGAALILRPDSPPAVMLDVEGETASALTSGRIAAALTWRAAEWETPEGISAAGGTHVTARSVAIGLGAEATSSNIDIFAELIFNQGKLVVAPPKEDGLLSSVLPPEGLTAPFSLAVRWSQDGVHFQGSAGLAATIPLDVTVGPLWLQSLDFVIRGDEGNVAAEAALTAAVRLGPVMLTIEHVGLAAIARAVPSSLGPVDVHVSFKPPTGASLAIDSPAVVGGGFLFHDDAQQLYAGAMQLSLHDRLTVKAFGLIATRMPDGSPGYSLLIFITAEDFRPIPLGLGFTLLGIGGMVGVNRTFDQDVLRAGMQNDTLKTLLFPRDPVTNAPAIVRSLASAFPARRGSYLLGLVAKIGWFTPTLVLMDLALILEFGSRERLLALGRISALLPSADNDLVRLNMEAMGVFDFDASTAAIDAVLMDSRLAHKFAITGSAALRAGFGDGPSFVLSVGGLNPHFAPPVGFPALERVTIALSSGNNPRLLCDAYFAITSNTVQFGARASLYASAAGFSVEGDIGFDVLLVQIVPPHFIADYHERLQLKSGSHNLFMVSLAGELEGPLPLRISGKATFEILWCDFSVHFDTTLVHGELPPLPPAVNVLAQLTQALASPSSWSTQRSAAQTHGVALRSLPPARPTAPIVLDPLGQLLVKEQVVPLNTARDIDTFGGAPVAGARRFALTAALERTPLLSAAAQAPFAPSQFFVMSDDEKLAAPSSESMDAGCVFGDANTVFDPAQIIPAPLEYQTIAITLQGSSSSTSSGFSSAHAASAVAPAPYTMSPAQLQTFTRSGAAARAPVRRVGRARFRNDSVERAASFNPKRWTIMPNGDGPAATVDPGVRTWSEYQAALKALNRGGARWQIVPTHETEA